MKKIFLILILVFAIGCGKDKPTEPSIPNMNGVWVGSGSGIIANYTMIQDVNNVSGSGTMSGLGSLSIIITGTCNYPTVSLTFNTSGYKSSYFEGVFTGQHTVVGKLFDTQMSIDFTLVRK